MITLSNVTKYYSKIAKKHYVLEDVTLTIPGNKNIAFMGKDLNDLSLLLKLLSGSVLPNRGNICSPKTFSWNAGLANTLQPEISAILNIKFIARLYRYDSYRIAEVVASIKEFTGLGNELEQPLKNLTPEMKSKLNVGLVLAFESDYIVLDRIIGGGNTPFDQRTLDTLKERLEKNQTNILAVSPALHKLREICECGIVLDGGKLYFFEDINEAIEEAVKMNKKIN